MAVSENLSSARVAPRSETFASATSSMMASSVAALDLTAPCSWRRRPCESARRGVRRSHPHPVPRTARFAKYIPSRMTTSRSWRSRSSAIPFARVGCTGHTSSSVQSERGRRARSHRIHLALIDLPQFGSLLSRSHWPKVSRKERMRSWARLVLVTPSAAESGVEVVVVDGVEQRHRLQSVARTHAPGSWTLPCRWCLAPWRPRVARRRA